MRKSPQFIENKYADVFKSFDNLSSNINEKSRSPQFRLKNLTNQKLTENQISPEILYKKLPKYGNFEQIQSKNHNLPLDALKIAKPYNNKPNTSLPSNLTQIFESSKPREEIKEEEIKNSYMQAKNFIQNKVSEKILEEPRTSFNYERARSLGSSVDTDNDQSFQNTTHKSTSSLNSILQDDKINCLKMANRDDEIHSELQYRKNNKYIEFPHLEPSVIEFNDSLFVDILESNSPRNDDFLPPSVDENDTSNTTKKIVKIQPPSLNNQIFNVNKKLRFDFNKPSDTNGLSISLPISPNGTSQINPIEITEIDSNSPENKSLHDQPESIEKSKTKLTLINKDLSLICEISELTPKYYISKINEEEYSEHKHSFQSEFKNYTKKNRKNLFSNEKSNTPNEKKEIMEDEILREFEEIENQFQGGISSINSLPGGNNPYCTKADCNEAPSNIKLLSSPSHTIDSSPRRTTTYNDNTMFYTPNSLMDSSQFTEAVKMDNSNSIFIKHRLDKNKNEDVDANIDIPIERLEINILTQSLKSEQIKSPKDQSEINVLKTTSPHLDQFFKCALPSASICVATLTHNKMFSFGNEEKTTINVNDKSNLDLPFNPRKSNYDSSSFTSINPNYNQNDMFTICLENNVDPKKTVDKKNILSNPFRSSIGVNKLMNKSDPEHLMSCRPALLEDPKLVPSRQTTKNNNNIIDNHQPSDQVPDLHDRKKFISLDENGLFSNNKVAFSPDKYSSENSKLPDQEIKKSDLIRKIDKMLSNDNDHQDISSMKSDIIKQKCSLSQLKIQERSFKLIPMETRKYMDPFSINLSSPISNMNNKIDSLLSYSSQVINNTINNFTDIGVHHEPFSRENLSFCASDEAKTALAYQMKSTLCGSSVFEIENHFSHHYNNINSDINEPKKLDIELAKLQKALTSTNENYDLKLSTMPFTPNSSLIIKDMGEKNYSVPREYNSFEKPDKLINLPTKKCKNSPEQYRYREHSLELEKDRLLCNKRNRSNSLLKGPMPRRTPLILNKKNQIPSKSEIQKNEYLISEIINSDSSPPQNRNMALNLTNKLAASYSIDFSPLNFTEPLMNNNTEIHKTKFYSFLQTSSSGFHQTFPKKENDFSDLKHSQRLSSTEKPPLSLENTKYSQFFTDNDNSFKSPNIEEQIKQQEKLYTVPLTRRENNLDYLSATR